ncbi:hypothetical protein GOBAR_AA20573 [Gossypium barbadense]|uniref:Protein PLANT CADMIUM RESISTANCE 2-like n=1 Tax=Gossypium barbadense TaxID=3634 RepID=A0A2P5X9S6_GOSBA|nr:hypothetical protein GOBAR_AA20573 [Gossypium barbadense]
MNHPSGQPQNELPWSAGFCDCCSDLKTCCISYWCPCITFGQIAEIVDKGSTSCGASGALYTLIMFVTGCGCLYSCCYRSKLRKQYNLKGGNCGDCMRHFCCEPCALTQEYRELQNRGFDMSIGWHANVEKNPGLAMAPATNMRRGEEENQNIAIASMDEEGSSWCK